MRKEVIGRAALVIGVLVLLSCSLPPEPQPKQPAPEDHLPLADQQVGSSESQIQQSASPSSAVKKTDRRGQFSSFDTARIGEGNLAGLASCGEKKRILTTFPVNLDDFPVITPLGYVGATAHLTPTPHLFLRPRRTGPGQKYTEASTVVAPADLRIYIVNFVEDISKEKKFETDYALYFSPCREVVGYLDHVWDLAPKLKAAVAVASPDFCREYTLIYDRPVDWKFCRTKVSVDVKEGEYLGRTGGVGNADVFDFALMDYRLSPHPYLDRERWTKMGNTFEEALYYTCPLHYFPDDLRAKAESRLGAENIKRTIQPLCGAVFQDKYGTAQGVWFAGNRDSKREHVSEFLSLVHEAVDPRTPQFAVGEGLPSIQYGDYFFTVEGEGKVNRDFADVLPEEVYCFDHLRNKQEQAVEGRILVQLPTERTLLLEMQGGACGGGPWAFLGRESRFER